MVQWTASALLCTADVARVLGITANGVRWLTNTGELTCLRTLAGQRIFHRQEVLRYVERRTAKKFRRLERLAQLARLRPRMVKAGLSQRVLEQGEVLRAKTFGI
jgi:hypothetical protein